MTAERDFTQEEWTLLGNASLAAAAAVALAEPRGGNRAADAIVGAWREAEEIFAGSNLLRALLVDFDPEHPRVRAQPPSIRAATI